MSEIRECDKEKWFVFVSYKREDGDKVYPIVEKLQEDGYNIWIDKEKMVAGDTWQKIAFEAIEKGKCRGMILFATERSLVSAPILSELKYSQVPSVARKHRKGFPIMVVDADGIIDTYGNTRAYSDYLWEKYQDRNCDDLSDMFRKVFVNDDDKDCTEFNKFVKSTKNYFAISEQIMEITGLDDTTTTLSGLSATDIEKAIDVHCSEVKISENTDITDTESQKRVNQDVKVTEGTNQDNQVGESTNGGSEPPVTSEPTPNPVPTSKPLGAGLWHFTGGGANAYIEWDGEKKGICVVRKDSRVGSESPRFQVNCVPAAKLKQELLGKRIIENDRFTADYQCNKMGTIINLLAGGSCSVPVQIKSGALRKADSEDMTDPSIPPAPRKNYYTYTIYGEKKTADSVTDIMRTVFEKFFERHPDQITENITYKNGLTGCLSMERKTISKFRVCEPITVAGHPSIYIGLSSSTPEKIKEMVSLLAVCDETDQFEIDDEELKNLWDTVIRIRSRGSGTFDGGTIA